MGDILSGCKCVDVEFLPQMGDAGGPPGTLPTSAFRPREFSWATVQDLAHYAVYIPQGTTTSGAETVGTSYADPTAAVQFHAPNQSEPGEGPTVYSNLGEAYPGFRIPGLVSLMESDCRDRAVTPYYASNEYLTEPVWSAILNMVPGPQGIWVLSVTNVNLPTKLDPGPRRAYKVHPTLGEYSINPPPISGQVDDDSYYDLIYGVSRPLIYLASRYTFVNYSGNIVSTTTDIPEGSYYEEVEDPGDDRPFRYTFYRYDDTPNAWVDSSDSATAAFRPSLEQFPCTNLLSIEYQVSDKPDGIFPRQYVSGAAASRVPLPATISRAPTNGITTIVDLSSLPPGGWTVSSDRLTKFDFAGDASTMLAGQQGTRDGPQNRYLQRRWITNEGEKGSDSCGIPLRVRDGVSYDYPYPLTVWGRVDDGEDPPSITSKWGEAYDYWIYNVANKEWDLINVSDSDPFIQDTDFSSVTDQGNGEYLIGEPIAFAVDKINPQYALFTTIDNVSTTSLSQGRYTFTVKIFHGIIRNAGLYGGDPSTDTPIVEADLLVRYSGLTATTTNFFTNVSTAQDTLDVLSYSAQSTSRYCFALWRRTKLFDAPPFPESRNIYTPYEIYYSGSKIFDLQRGDPDDTGDTGYITYADPGGDGLLPDLIDGERPNSKVFPDPVTFHTNVPGDFRGTMSFTNMVLFQDEAPEGEAEIAVLFSGPAGVTFGGTRFADIVLLSASGEVVHVHRFEPGATPPPSSEYAPIIGSGHGSVLMGATSNWVYFISGPENHNIARLNRFDFTVQDRSPPSVPTPPADTTGAFYTLNPFYDE